MIDLSSYEQSLVQMWQDCGTLKHNGMGVTSIEWQDVKAWADLFYTETYIEWVTKPNPKRPSLLPIPVTQYTLSDWELRQIMRMSEEYCAEYVQASEPSRECPKAIFIEDVPEDVAMENAKAIRQGFRDLFGKGGVSAQDK